MWILDIFVPVHIAECYALQIEDDLQKPINKGLIPSIVSLGDSGALRGGTGREKVRSLGNCL